MMTSIVVLSAVILTVAYVTYGRLLPRLFRIDPNQPTPAFTMRDDVDYVPCNKGPLLSQHFSAIAAAGPIVGPILAGAYFGWLPALLWILVGSIFVGGVHDFASLIASVRHKADSISEVVRQHISGRAFVLFLIFIWLALVYIIVAFTDITATAFIDDQVIDGGETVLGKGIATSSLLYLLLPIVMGIVVRFGKVSMEKATWIFIPLVILAIWVGQKFPLDITSFSHLLYPQDTDREAARKTWNVLLLGYCCIASVVPLWLLLQPRGQLGGYFLYAALIAGGLGIVMGGGEVHLPAFKGMEASNGFMLAPMLFITIACGACSGFHGLIASGTTSKQLRTEADARPIGYGAMLLEAMVAIVSLCCVMMLVQDSPLAQNPKPEQIYARGIGAFLAKVGVNPMYGIAFALMAFTTFVYDTLDVCTRLGRFIIQELTGMRGAAGKWLGTLFTAGVPVYFVTQTVLDKDGKPGAPVWRTFWQLFGASNQLLAALTLLGVTVWLWRTRRAWWVWVVTGIPAIFMYVMSGWALLTIIRAEFAKSGSGGSPVGWISVTLVALAGVMLVEAFVAIAGGLQPPSAREPQPAAV
ncbi:Inner membrane protein YjiY [Caulifigura coniformis]|uniref:Inner membrane protein YjiY n=1 Tax=Caulifigura coniformis TaxID=2527983 RepID=A0A517SGV1_9PLAN|nr:carbon starvation CstA family protein [Caulifigura coniformis]QDT55355.1 Inner membrane protein YjiY [Caulifigura coniformis]